MDRRIAFLLLVLVGFSGCATFRSTDRTFLSNSLAEWTYLNEDYKAACVAKKGPPTCQARADSVREAGRQLDVAAKVVVIGAIPSVERRAIRLAMKKARS